MIGSLVYAARRWWLRTRLDRLIALANRTRKVAIRAKTDPNVIVNDLWPERTRLSRAIMELETDYLLQQARWLSVPLPDEDKEGMWVDARVDGRWFLTDKGQFTLRAALRLERKDRLESWRLWLPTIAAALSAVAAWVAALHK